MHSQYSILGCTLSAAVGRPKANPMVRKTAQPRAMTKEEMAAVNQRYSTSAHSLNCILRTTYVWARFFGNVNLSMWQSCYAYVPILLSPLTPHLHMYYIHNTHVQTHTPHACAPHCTYVLYMHHLLQPVGCMAGYPRCRGRERSKRRLG